MAFWSGEKLKSRLPALITPFYPTRTDCAAYTLSVGAEVFITEDEPPTGDPRKGVKFVVEPNAPFRIPPGQFAFLTTEEVVEVPADALAFISMKATYKFRGLVNVSGFHVDPGWKGPLIFSVYNAGPAPVHLSRGLSLFLIWYADLDQATKELYKPKPNGTPGLRDDLISNMSGQVFSPMNLSRQLDSFKDKISAQFDKTREEQMQLKVELANFKTIAYIVSSVAGTVFLGLVSFFAKPVWEISLKTYVEQQQSPERISVSDKHTTSPINPPLSDPKGVANQPSAPAETDKNTNVVPEKTKSEKSKIGTTENRPSSSSDTRENAKKNVNGKPAEAPAITTAPLPPPSEGAQATH